jgi:hypothetical protein
LSSMTLHANLLRLFEIVSNAPTNIQLICKLSKLQKKPQKR